MSNRLLSGYLGPSSERDEIPAFAGMTDRELSRDQTDATVKAVRGHPDPVGGRRAGSPAHTRKRHIETQLAGELRLGRAGCHPHQGNRLPEPTQPRQGGAPPHRGNELIHRQPAEVQQTPPRRRLRHFGTRHPSVRRDDVVSARPDQGSRQARRARTAQSSTSLNTSMICSAVVAASSFPMPSSSMNTTAIWPSRSR